MDYNIYKNNNNFKLFFLIVLFCDILFIDTSCMII